MKKLYASNNRIKMYVLKSILEDAGIASLMKNEAVAGQAAGEIPPTAVMPELWVMDDAQYARAMELIRTEDRATADIGSAWVCQGCGERLDGQFNVCWKCGHGR